MATVLIALVDKAFPPDHSFVRGVLGRSRSLDTGLKARICVSAPWPFQIAPHRFERAVCVPRLAQRRHFGRFMNFILAIGILRYQIRRERRRGREVILFVRNCPILLLAAAALRPSAKRLVFQSSFPHEEYTGGHFKRHFARAMYRLAGRSVDAVTGVSPAGVERVSAYCPKAAKGPYIPLLSDWPVRDQAEIGSEPTRRERRFVYIGSHRRSRELDVVLSGIVQALESGARGRFVFLGASSEERRWLVKVEGVNAWIRRRRIEIRGPVVRSEVRPFLQRADVGLSLIPPKRVFVEASPTKLSEYLATGLMVLASRGIPLQEEVVEASGGGMLCDWGVDQIARLILHTDTMDEHELTQMRRKGLKFARRELTYESFKPQFLELIGGKA